MSSERRVYVRRQSRTTAGQARGLENLDKYRLDSVDFQSEFKRAGPVLVEIGFGNGSHLAEYAASHTDWNCVGVEVFRSGIGGLVSRLERETLTNVRVVECEGLTFLESVQDGTIDEILVLFPDPWPKRRHWRRRMVTAEFGRVACAKLKPGGKLVIATDWAPYAEEIEANLSQVVSLKGGIALEPLKRAATKYEKRGQGLGHKITEFEYQAI